MYNAIAATLERLESTGLIRVAQLEPDLEYLFRHALVQDAVYESLLKQDRRKLHLAVGEALERAYPDRLDALADRLADHFLLGGDDARALEYSTRAGDHAFAQYALREAIMYYASARGLAVKLSADSAILRHVALREGRAFELLGMYEHAHAIYQDLENIAQEAGDQPLLLAAIMAAATIHSTPSSVHDPAHGIELSERALELARALPDRAAEAKILWNLCLAYSYGLGDVPKAVAYGERSLKIARELGLKEQEAYTLTDLGGMYYLLGGIEQSLEATEQAVPLWRELRNVPMLAFCLNTRAQALEIAGRFADAERDAWEALEMCRVIGNHEGMGYSLGTLYEVSMRRGRVGEAMRFLADSILLPANIGTSFMARSRSAMLYGRLGARNRIDALTDEIMNRRLLEGLPHMLRLDALSVFAEAELDSGAPGRASAMLQQEAGPSSDIMPGVDLIQYAGVLLAKDALLRHSYGEALDVVDRTLAYFVKSGMRYNMHLANWMRGRALIGLGRYAEALDALRAAHVEAKATGTIIDLWRVLAAQADLEEAHGEGPEAAASLRREARAVLEGILATMGDHPDLRESLLAMPDAAALWRG